MDDEDSDISDEVIVFNATDSTGTDVESSNIIGKPQSTGKQTAKKVQQPIPVAKTKASAQLSMTEQKNKSKTPQNSRSNPTVFESRRSEEVPLIVIDAANVAMRHGLNSKFSCKGIKLAMDFFHRMGHPVIGFIPDYYLSFEKIGELRRVGFLNVGDVKVSKLPDDVSLLQQLVSSGHLISTPPQDYDDSYSIAYARSHGGYLVSNDLYRDHVKSIQDAKTRSSTKDWLKLHCISFTFVGDEFLPNPNASFVTTTSKQVTK